MEIKYFDDVRFKGDWEWNLIGKNLNIRIGRSQWALWWKYRPIINWLGKSR